MRRDQAEELLWRREGTDEIGHQVDGDGEVARRLFVQMINLRDGVIGLMVGVESDEGGGLDDV